MTDKQLLAREASREKKRQWMYHKRGNGRRFIYIDSLPKDENGENDLDRLGIFSDGGKGAANIRNFDADDFAKLTSAFRKINPLEREIVKKVIQNGSENRERTIRWVMKNQLNRHYHQKRRFNGNTSLQGIGTSANCDISKKS